MNESMATVIARFRAIVAGPRDSREPPALAEHEHGQRNVVSTPTPTSAQPMRRRVPALSLSATSKATPAASMARVPTTIPSSGKRSSVVTMGPLGRRY